MSEPGDHRPKTTGYGAGPADPGAREITAAQPRSRAQAIGLAILVVVLAATGWAFLRGILELGVGLVAVAFLGGWGIGATTRMAKASPIVAVILAAAAWLLGLIFTWLLALAILPGSSRTFIERVEGTSFIDWMGPQFGLVEIIGLVVYVVTAVYASTRAGASRSSA